MKMTRLENDDLGKIDLYKTAYFPMIDKFVEIVRVCEGGTNIDDTMLIVKYEDRGYNYESAVPVYMLANFVL